MKCSGVRIVNLTNGRIPRGKEKITLIDSDGRDVVKVVKKVSIPSIMNKFDFQRAEKLLSEARKKQNEGKTHLLDGNVVSVPILQESIRLYKEVLKSLPCGGPDDMKKVSQVKDERALVEKDLVSAKAQFCIPTN
jgi:hypothetical protein